MDIVNLLLRSLCLYRVELSVFFHLLFLFVAGLFACSATMLRGE